MNANELFVFFHGILVSLKLYHYKTKSGFRHERADALISELGGKVDTLLETAQGHTGTRINVTDLSLPLFSLTDANVSSSLGRCADTTAELVFRHQDLTNIRDELEGILRKFSFLLSFD